MDVSIIVPLYNEEESLPELLAWIDRVTIEAKLSREIILIDDGSSDASWDVVRSLSSTYQGVKGIRFRRNYGKSAALQYGFQTATGEVIITMDADLQDSPDEIPGLYDMIQKQGLDLVSGWKKKRYDPISKTIPSKFFNYTARKVTGIKLHDFNCGLKAYRRELAKSIEVYGEMHRYIPVLAQKAGFTKIGERIVQHRERKYGVTKFGWERFINGFLDLMSITFISRFGKKPMHLFGTLGTLMFMVGFFSAFYLGLMKLWYVYQQVKAPLVTYSPYFYLSLTSMIVGTQLFLAGFLGELISRTGSERNVYQVEEEI
jgi:glycosyltransferase involved in cell wall biosynthesis